MKPLRVLVVDDSQASRDQVIATVNNLPSMEVVGVATNGADALRLVRERTPDAITLDLEMPEMDGFSFLRVLMATHPLPVIVVSSDTRRDSVLRALELGALDFVAKKEGDPQYFDMVLAQKLALVRGARVGRPTSPGQRAVRADRAPSANWKAPRFVFAIAASTGGPSALIDLFSRLSGADQVAVVIVQHMPSRFTSTFAERLNRHGPFSVHEAKDGDIVAAGRALLCPGDRCMHVVRMPERDLAVRVTPPHPEEKVVPNATRLLTSVARHLGVRAVGIVLTGMGDDGAEGAREIAERGGRVFVESEATAVIYGMPQAAKTKVPSAIEVRLNELPRRLGELIS